MTLQVRLDLVNQTLNAHPSLKEDADVLSALFRVDFEISRFERLVDEKVAKL